MDFSPEWEKRIALWMDELPRYFYRPLEEMEMQGFTTMDALSPEQAARGVFAPMAAGQPWGAKWEYGWFRGSAVVPECAQGERVVLCPDVGGESLVWINGRTAGAKDKFHTAITLTRDAEPGTRYDVLIESYAGHGPRLENGAPCPPGTVTIVEPPACQVRVGHTTFGIWNEMAYQLWMDVQTLLQVRNCISKRSLRYQRIEKALRDFTLTVDFELPEEERNCSFAEGRAALASALACHNGSTAPEMFVFGQSHLDLAWLWTRAETWRKSGRTVSNQLALLDEYPEYLFFWCEPPLYLALKERYPDLYARVKEKIKTGQMTADGAMWVESDTNLPSGESLIRQILYGRRFYREELGVDSKMVWLPDCFGFSASLPQIMKGCGVQYFATQKIIRNYNGGDPFPYNIFWWEGNDGTRILSHIFKKNNAHIDPATMITRWEEDRNQQEDIDIFLYPFGYGDGGGGPTRDFVEFMRRMDDLEGVPRIRRAFPEEFFHEVEKRGGTQNRYVGELYFQNHRGTYTSQARIKKGNRKGELALREAEFWSAAASLQGAAYPAQELEKNWKKLLFGQFHDVLPGTSITRVCQEAEADFDAVRQAAERITDRSVERLTDGTEALTVFNSLNWVRTIPVALPEGWRGARDQAGNILPVRREGKRLVTLLALPACGSVVLYPADSSVERTRVSEAFVLENEHLRAELDGMGRLVGVWDQKTGHQWLSAPGNDLRLYKDISVKYEAWDIDSMYRSLPVELDQHAELTWIANDALGQTIRVRRKIGNSQMEQMISLQRGARRIEFATTIDWQEHHKLLKVDFPTDLHCDNALHELQYGYIERPTHDSRQYDKDRYEVCNHKWTALAEDGRGAAVLNDCKYGVSVREGTISLTLLRAPKVPDMYADLGEQRFTYAFTVWDGTFAQADVVRQGYELNTPVTTARGAGEIHLVELSDPNVILDEVKCAEDGSGSLILRLFQSKRTLSSCAIKLGFDVSACWRTNMLEEKIERLTVNQREIQLVVKPFEVVTLYLKSVKE